MTTPIERLPWRPVEDLSPGSIPINGSIAALDALRQEWQRRLAEFTESDRTRVRQRSLRKLAIETGILERLYEIEWGLTLTLVSEGFARDVVERHGGAIDEHTRVTLEAQRDSLQMVLNYVEEGRDLTVSFIKELHAAITRTQLTYSATDSLGRPVELSLTHGAWKTEPNHVMRSDGRLLEYAPPEHTPAEVERLVELHRRHEQQGIHPIISAAWLHHRFVQIHPFADGNGRVARALVLLVLQKHHYAPLVVDRFHRDKYLSALDNANDGDLAPLVRLFVNLESATLASELETPPDAPTGTSREIAHTLADQVRAIRRARETALGSRLRPRALAIGAQLRTWFEAKSRELRSIFSEVDGADLTVLSDYQIGEGSERRHWFREQIVSAAHRVGHYAEFGPESGWAGLRIKTSSLTLRFIAALHGAGQSSGVLAVVTFAEIESRWRDEEGESRRERSVVDTSPDAFRVVHTEAIEAINGRAHELTDILEEGLSVALAEFIKRVRHTE